MNGLPSRWLSYDVQHFVADDLPAIDTFAPSEVYKRASMFPSSPERKGFSPGGAREGNRFAKPKAVNTCHADPCTLLGLAQVGAEIAQVSAAACYKNYYITFGCIFAQTPQ